MKACLICGAEIKREDTNYFRKKYCGTACYRATRPHDAAMSLRAFWEKVDKTGSCWVWTACKNDSGYGLTTWEGRKNIRAHRLSYELAYGPVPAGLAVCHRCDNRVCVRPDHLYVGTWKDNTDDKVAKGRHAVGEAARHKLTKAQALEILSLKGKTTAVELCKSYDVAPGTVGAIWAGRSWKHLQRTPQHSSRQEQK